MNHIQRMAEREINEAENALKNPQWMTAKEKNWWKSIIKTNKEKIKSFNF
jgi:hypothetical protein